MLQRALFSIFFLCFVVTAGAQTIVTVAGSNWVFPGAATPAVQAPLGRVSAVAVGQQGSYYISDPSNNLVLKVDGSGTLTIAAGNGISGYSGDNGPATSASLNTPAGLAVDSGGNLFIADSSNHRIRMVSPAGVITTIAGNGTQGFSGDTGPAVAAQLNGPSGVAVDSSGNLYIADTYNGRIRMVTADGAIATMAGNGVQGFAGDTEIATAASLNSPQAVCVDGLGNLFIADTNNYRIREVNPAGIITTVAGNGEYSFAGDGGPALNASISPALGLAVDAAGDIFIADTYNRRIREVNTNGIINTVAGNGGGLFSGDNGPAIKASIYFPAGVAVDTSGDLYIADLLNERVREVSTAGIITTVAGDGLYRFSGDGGAAVNASLYLPGGVAMDSAGDIVIADTGNQRIRKVNPSGVITTMGGIGIIGGSGDHGPATQASLSFPQDVAADTAGNIYIAASGNNRVRKISSSGTITTVAGSGTPAYSGDNGPAINAALYGPRGVAVDSVGNVFIADSANNRVRKVNTAGIITTVAGNGNIGYSGDNGPAANAALNNPVSLAVDRTGNLFIADSGNNRIRKVDLNGNITTVAGNGVSGQSGDCGLAVNAELSRPYGVAVDSAGTLFIADTYNNRIREVTPYGYILTVAGSNTQGYGGDNGPSLNAELNYPQSISVDSQDNLLVADTSNQRIRKVTGLTPLASGPPTVWIDYPAPGSTIAGLVSLAGWAIDNTSGIGTAINGSNVQVLVDGAPIGMAAYGVPRPDVCGVLVERPGCPNVGYQFSLNAAALAPGQHTITVLVNDSNPSPQAASASTTVNVVSGILPAPPAAGIDSPVAGATVSGNVTVSGWAVDNATGIGTSIGLVQVQVDGAVVGTATYGILRSDVCGIYVGRPGCPYVGYSYQLNTNFLTPGPHTVTVTATDTESSADTGSASVNIQVNASALPIVRIETPLPGLQFLAGVTTTVSGWAMDSLVGGGTPINPSSLRVKVDGVVMGQATYGVSRLDVCAAYPGEAGCPNVGYTFQLNTAGLAAGPHTLKVLATDTNPTPLVGSAGVNFQIVSAAAPPAVFIDAPANGAVVSGFATVSGWAVDDIGVVGSRIASIQVKVDGAPVGFATYGTARPDVCKIFPDRAGCPNVGYIFGLNTGSLRSGPHTLTVTATDSDGNADYGTANVTIFVNSFGPPTVDIDTPTNGSTVSGMVTVSGWALDNASGIGTPINPASLVVKVDGQPVGNANYGTTRQDVCSVLPGRPGCPNVGYTFGLNTTPLTKGQHTITVSAMDADSPPETGSASVTVLVQ